MCGRLNIIEDPFSQIVSEQLGLAFSTKPNSDLRPTDVIDCVVASPNGELFQIPLRWGIKPSWSKKVIINAQSESVHQKPTFKDAFSYHRAVIPCSGWYEWSDKGQGNKVKYLFSEITEKPLYMAGIGYPESKEVVSLTTSPSRRYEEYHHRMPMLLGIDEAKIWLTDNKEAAATLLNDCVDRVRWISKLVS